MGNTQIKLEAVNVLAETSNPLLRRYCVYLREGSKLFLDAIEDTHVKGLLKLTYFTYFRRQRVPFISRNVFINVNNLNAISISRYDYPTVQFKEVCLHFDGEYPFYLLFKEDMVKTLSDAFAHTLNV